MKTSQSETIRMIHSRNPESQFTHPGFRLPGRRRLRWSILWRGAIVLPALLLLLAAWPVQTEAASPLAQEYAALRTLREIRQEIIDLNTAGTLDDHPGMKYLGELLFGTENPTDTTQPLPERRQAFVRGALFAHALSRTPSVWSTGDSDDFVHKREVAAVYSAVIRQSQTGTFSGNKDIEAFALGAIVHYWGELLTNQSTYVFAGGYYGEPGDHIVYDWSYEEGLPIDQATGDPYNPATTPGVTPQQLPNPSASQVRERHYFFESWVTAWLLDTEGIASGHADGLEKDIDLYDPGSFTTTESQFISQVFENLYVGSFGTLPDPVDGFGTIPDLIGTQIEAYKGNVGSSITSSNPSLAASLQSSGLVWLWNLPESGKVGAFAQALGLISPEIGALPNEILNSLKIEVPERALTDLEAAAAVLRVGRGAEFTLSDSGLEDINLYDAKLPDTAAVSADPKRKAELEGETESIFAAVMNAPGQVLFHALDAMGNLAPNAKAPINFPSDPKRLLYNPRSGEAYVYFLGGSKITRLYNEELAEPDPAGLAGDFELNVGGPVAAAAYFPDGRFLAAALGGGVLVVHDTLTNQQVMNTVLPIPSGMYPIDIAVDPDGSKIYVLETPGEQGTGVVQMASFAPTPVVSTFPLAVGKGPTRMAFDPFEKKLAICTSEYMAAYNTYRTMMYLSPRTGALYLTQSKVQVWNPLKNRVDESFNWNWLVEKNSIPLLPLQIALCGFGASAFISCFVNIAIITTIQTVTSSILVWTIRNLHSAVYVQMINDPLSVDYYAQAACLALSVLGGGFGLMNWFIGFLAGQACNFNADMRAQATYVDVFAPVDIAISTVHVPTGGPRVTQGVMCFRTANMAFLTDQLKTQGQWSVPCYQAATFNRLGNMNFGIGNDKDILNNPIPRKGEMSFGRAIGIDQLGNMIGVIEITKDSGGGKRIEFSTIRRPRLDLVLDDPATYLPFDRIWAQSRAGVTDVLTLSKRPAGDKIHYSSVLALWAMSLTFNVPGSDDDIELMNTNMDQSLPSYDSGVEISTDDPQLAGGSLRARSIAARPSFVLRSTNVVGDPVSGGVVLEVESRRMLDGISLYIWNRGDPMPDTPVSDSLYDWQFRNDEKTLARIVVPKLALLPNMGTAEEFQARVDVTYAGGGTPILSSLFAYGKTGTVLDTSGASLLLEAVDVNNALMRDQFDNPSAGSPNYNDLITDLGTGDGEGGSVRQPSRIVCDGVSMVLLRAKAPAEGRVTFRLLPGDRRPIGIGDAGGHQNGEIRGLANAIGVRHVNEFNFQFGPAATDDTITVDTVSVSGDDWAFALYTPPQDFVRYDKSTLSVVEPDRTEPERSISFTAAFEPGNPDDLPANAAAAAVLSRKPLVFVHDIGSGPEAWDRFGRLAATTGDHPGYPDALRKYVDYKASNMACYNFNAPKLAQETTDYLNTLRGTGYAVARVDIIAHGSGAMLARLWANGVVTDADLIYNHTKTFSQGYISRMIALGAPFQGAPASNFAIAMLGRSSSVARQVLQAVGASGLSTSATDPDLAQEFYTRYMSALVTGLAQDTGAVLDVSIHQPPAAYLDESPIKTHAIAGARSQGTAEETAMGAVEGRAYSGLWQILALGFQDSLEADHTARMKVQPVVSGAGQVIHLIDRLQGMGNGWQFAPEEHDEWVAWSSQTGRLALPNTSFVKQTHFEMLKSMASGALPPVPTIGASYLSPATAEEAVVGLLDVPEPAGAFSDSLPDLNVSGYWGNASNFVNTSVGIPYTSSGCNFSRPDALIQDPLPLAEFVTPSDGEGVGAGPLTVQVALAPGLLARAVVAVTPFGVAPLPTDGTPGTINIPGGVGGSFNMGILFVANTGGVYGGPVITLNLPSSGSPLSLRTRSATIGLLGPGDVGQVAPILSAPESGDWVPAPGDPSVTYTSSDTSVVEVGTDGVVRALAPGDAVVTVKTGDLEKQVRVKVGDTSPLEAAPLP